jgi:hypothetical protein
MEETGILENPALLSLVLPAFEPGREFRQGEKITLTNWYW